MREKRERSAIRVERKHIGDTSRMVFPPHRIGFGGIGFWFSFSPTHSGTLSLRQRELLGAEVWFPKGLGRGGHSGKRPGGGEQEASLALGQGDQAQALGPGKPQIERSRTCVGRMSGRTLVKCQHCWQAQPLVSDSHSYKGSVLFSDWLFCFAYQCLGAMRSIALLLCLGAYTANPTSLKQTGGLYQR